MKVSLFQKLNTKEIEKNIPNAQVLKDGLKDFLLSSNPFCLPLCKLVWFLCRYAPIVFECN